MLVLYNCVDWNIYNKVFNPPTIDDLKMAITDYIRNVDSAILNTVF